MQWLGVDMGGSATRWAARDASGALVARGTAPGATGLVFDASARAAFAAALAPARALPGLRAAYLGVTGAGFDNDPVLNAAAAGALNLPTSRVTIVNDMVLAWHAVWPRGGGHLVSAGTGSVGLGRALQTNVHLAPRATTP